MLTGITTLSTGGELTASLSAWAATVRAMVELPWTRALVSELLAQLVQLFLADLAGLDAPPQVSIHRTIEYPHSAGDAVAAFLTRTFHTGRDSSRAVYAHINKPKIIESFRTQRQHTQWNCVSG